MNNLPLVTFGVKFHNQRIYVKEVLGSAVYQTYRPLEIVVVDDASTDNTDAIVRAFIENYKKSGGDLEIRYERNATNLGNVGTFERVASLARGELLIQADGDDISLKNRTSEVVKCWMEHGKKPWAIIHSFYNIDPENRVFGSASAYSFGVNLPVGAAMAWNPRVVTDFPKCLNSRVVDDAVMVVRAVYHAPIAYCDSILGCHRVGVGVSTSLYDDEEAEWKCIVEARKCYDQWNADLELMRGGGSEKYEEMKALVESLIQMWESHAKELEDRQRLSSRLMVFCQGLMRLALALLPKIVAKKLMTIKGVIKHQFDVRQWNKKIVVK